jgi:UDP-2,3-diacylglucosamine pyrophosphatase LpxH
MPQEVKKNKIDTLIISDLHLGSFVSRADKLAELLRSMTFKRLILLGDIFDNSNFSRLSEENWELLNLIRKYSDSMSDSKPECEVVWIRGNHDKRIADLMAYFTGAKVYDQYVWEFRDRRYLALHGDLFDNFSLGESFIGRLGQQVYLLIQRFDRSGRHIVRLIDRSHASFRRLSQRVADGAIEHARSVQAQYVFCGHTHKPMERVVSTLSPSPIHYYNVGCWTRSPSTFVAIHENGEILLQTVT